MNIIGIIGIFYFSISGFFFVEPNNLFSVLLPDSTQLVQIDTLEGGTINYIFVGSNLANNLEYSLSLSVVQDKFTNLLDRITIREYEEDCNCNVMDAQKSVFANFKGVKYSITKNVENIHLAGFVFISEGRNNRSINIVALTIDNKSVKLEPLLESILNTLVLNF